MNKIIIIGGGLSGLTAAVNIAKSIDNVEITIIEKGLSYDERITTKDQILCGMGGAGTTAGGKLCFPPASNGVWEKTKADSYRYRIFYNNFLRDVCGEQTNEKIRIQDVNFNEHLWKKEYASHLLLQNGMNGWIKKSILNAERYGVLIRTGCEAVSYEDAGNFKRVFIKNRYEKTEELKCEYIIFATGRTSPKFLKEIFPSSWVSEPCPDLGIRITLPNKSDIFCNDGEDIKFKKIDGDFLLRTFCVCTGGEAAVVNYNGMKYFDGHFSNELSNQVNLGILGRSRNLSGFNVASDYISFMQKYTDESLSLETFTKEYMSLTEESIYGPLFKAIVGFINVLREKGVFKQNFRDIQVLIPSVDHLNPRINVDQFFETLQKNVFVIGDASGISRGFVQAMWAGWCASERIIEKIKYERVKYRSAVAI